METVELFHGIDFKLTDLAPPPKGFVNDQFDVPGMGRIDRVSLPVTTALAHMVEDRDKTRWVRAGR